MAAADTSVSLVAFSKALHMRLIMQFVGFYVLLVHCGIMHSNICCMTNPARLKVLGQFVFMERFAQHVV